MWITLLDKMLSALFKHGQLHVSYPDGATRTYGDGTGEAIRVELTDTDIVKRIVLNPELAAGEGYMEEKLKVEDDRLREFLGLCIRNIEGGSGHVWWIRATDHVRTLFRRFYQANRMGRARQNVAHHYDLSGKLYDLFLDSDKQYSCAYFSDPEMSLEAAQAAKKEHIARKLLIEPGMTVLDIGCGWGGMGLTLARDYGAKVVGVTLSEEQHKIARQRAVDAGLSDVCDFRLTDYRNVTETFDRIVSVGMFEHVGVPHYREYFRNVSDRLKPDGVALIHTIGRTAPPGFTNPWIEKYIFPGGYVPALSEMMLSLEQEGLYETDVEIWRLHYAETLKHWHDRFTANEDRARELYDERFCRMWRYYLAACEMAFRCGRQAVFQVQLAHRQDAVPLTRDYLYSSEPQREVRHAAE